MNSYSISRMLYIFNIVFNTANPCSGWFLIGMCSIHKESMNIHIHTWHKQSLHTRWALRLPCADVGASWAERTQPSYFQSHGWNAREPKGLDGAALARPSLDFTCVTSLASLTHFQHWPAQEFSSKLAFLVKHSLD